MKRFSLLVPLFLAGVAFGSGIPTPEKVPFRADSKGSAGRFATAGPLDDRIEPALRLTLERLGASGRASAQLLSLPSGSLDRNGLERFPSVVQALEGGGVVVPVIVRAKDVAGALRAIEAAGGSWSTVSAGRIVARLAATKVEELAASPAVAYVDGSHWLRRALDQSRAEMKVDPVHVGSGLSRSYRGGGVVVGFVDTGIDWAHPDFRDASGKSRIQWLWDMSGGGSPPGSFNYGRECAKADIDAGGCQEVDANGHGTHVAGIAAGNGAARGGQYRGVAPEADLVVVKGLRTGESFASTDVLDGCSYVFEKAAALGRSAVVNLSIVGHFGPHDGSSDYERALDGLAGPGRVIVVANGNDGARRIHLGYSLGGTDYLSGTSSLLVPVARTVTVRAYVSSSAGFSFGIRALGTDGKPFDATPDIPVGKKYTQPFARDGAAVATVTVDSSAVLEDGTRSILLQFEDAGTGVGAAAYELYSFGSGRLDAWILDGRSAEWSGATAPGFAPGDGRMSVAIPATARNVVSVGAHVTRTSWLDATGATRTPGSWCGTTPDVALGRIACFSSLGPTRDGRVKPDLTAPGQFVVSTLSRDFLAPDFSSLALGGGYLVDQGTSMAAPHVAGLVALLLQVRPALTPDGARQILQQTARTDGGGGGSMPDNTWGAGKADALAALQSAASSTGAGAGGGGPVLSLLGGRVAVSVAWRSQYSGETGNATAIPQQDQFGYFAFGDVNNPEVFVKVLDFGASRPYLLFYAGLTDFEYTVTFENVASGKKVSYLKPAGSMAGGANATDLPQAAPALRSLAAVLPTPVPAAAQLSLSGGRIAVTLTWRNQYDGTTGTASALGQKDAFGYFTFSDPGNPEVFVKVLDFGPSRPFLLFWAGLTDLEYTLTAWNTGTGQAVTHFKPASTTDGGADTTGLAWSSPVALPVAAFSFSPTSPAVYELVTFTNQSAGATSYAWSFADGTTSTAANPTKRYSTEGTFSVRLTATGAPGSDSTARTIDVQSAPTARTTRIEVANSLVRDVLVRIGGVETFVAPAGGTAGADVVTLDLSLRVDVETVPVRNDAGEVIPGSRTLQMHWYAVPVVDRGTETLRTSPSFPETGEAYFAPLLANASGVAVEEVVNFGLPDQFRCACSIAPGAVDVYLGYYQLHPGSVVAVFRPGDYPLGSYRYFSGLAPAWNRQTGALPLQLTVPPISNRSRDPGAVPLPLSPLPGRLPDAGRLSPPG